MKLCKCHGEPMWRNNSNGGWRCALRTERRNRRSELRQMRKQILEELSVRTQQS